MIFDSMNTNTLLYFISGISFTLSVTIIYVSLTGAVPFLPGMGGVVLISAFTTVLLVFLEERG